MGEGGGSKAKQAPKKAIALRLEPLRPGVPEFEKVMSEDRQTITVGTNKALVDIVVRDEIVSKKHCMLALVGIHGELALSIQDSSSNGTYVNGERLAVKQKKYRIRNGDKLELKHPDVDAGFGWKVDFGNTVAFFSRG